MVYRHGVASQSRRDGLRVAQDAVLGGLGPNEGVPKGTAEGASDTGWTDRFSRPCRDLTRSLTSPALRAGLLSAVPAVPGLLGSLSGPGVVFFTASPAISATVMQPIFLSAAIATICTLSLCLRPGWRPTGRRVRARPGLPGPCTAAGRASSRCRVAPAAPDGCRTRATGPCA